MELLDAHNVSLGFFDSSLEVYETKKPYVCLVPLTHAPKDFPQSNIEYVNKDVDVKDIRGFESLFRLDTHGFQLVHHHPTFTAWQDGKKVVEEYYPYIVQLLKKHLGNVRVHIYDHTTRLGDHVDAPDRNRQVQGLPSVVAHVDHSMGSTVSQIKDDFGSEAKDLMKHRFQIINVWHPIVEPVETQPLTLCDYRTAKADVFPADLIYPHICSENMVVRYSTSQQWYFIDRQKINEAWIFKMQDSATLSRPEVSQFCTHTSFRAPWASSECKARESIEFRAYVFYVLDSSDSEESLL